MLIKLYSSLIEKCKSELQLFALKDGDFSRQRKLPISALIGHMLYLTAHKNEVGYGINASLYAQDLSSYVKKEVSSVRASSFSEARQKLSHEAFDYLLNEANLEHEGKGRWKGHRVRSVDGSTIVLPYSDDIVKKYPRAVNQGRLQHYPRAKIVVATNIITKQPIACSVHPNHTGERQILKELVEHKFQARDISILDRGFEGKETWLHISEHQQYFIGRVRNPAKGKKSYVSDFLKSGKKEAIIDLEYQNKTLKVRIIRGKKLKWGYLIVVTNLLETKRYKRREILELYKQRQEVEKTFLFSKPHLKLEKFRSKKCNGVLQEIFCNLFFISMVFGLIYSANIPLEKIASFKWVAILLKRNIFAVIDQSISNRLADSLLAKALDFCEPRRKPRSYPRHSHQPVNPWPMARRPGGWRHRKNSWQEKSMA